MKNQFLWDIWVSDIKVLHITWKSRFISAIHNSTNDAGLLTQSKATTRSSAPSLGLGYGLANCKKFAIWVEVIGPKTLIQPLHPRICPRGAIPRCWAAFTGAKLRNAAFGLHKGRIPTNHWRAKAVWISRLLTSACVDTLLKCFKPVSVAFAACKKDLFSTRFRAFSMKVAFALIRF